MYVIKINETVVLLLNITCLAVKKYPSELTKNPVPIGVGKPSSSGSGFGLKPEMSHF